MLCIQSWQQALKKKSKRNVLGFKTIIPYWLMILNSLFVKLSTKKCIYLFIVMYLYLATQLADLYCA